MNNENESKTGKNLKKKELRRNHNKEKKNERHAPSLSFDRAF
tara:strand:- start:223 stop:348 length:126 start_codon:yes stop_codon:yes gene_type:complete